MQIHTSQGYKLGKKQMFYMYKRKFKQYIFYNILLNKNSIFSISILF